MNREDKKMKLFKVKEKLEKNKLRKELLEKNLKIVIENIVVS